MQKITLPPSFPKDDYTPYGYIDNPSHTAVLNRSGILRSVPPLGFGFWCRRLPFPYGEGARRRINYLSFLHLSLSIGGVRLHTETDFRRTRVSLASKYHTKTMMSYDWGLGGLSFSAKYFLANEHALVCVLESENHNEDDRTFLLHATNIYGYPETPWWGCDGVAALRTEEPDAAVSKIWAYGDVFVVGANRPSTAFKSTPSEETWERWITDSDLSSNAGASVIFAAPGSCAPGKEEGPGGNRPPDDRDCLYTMLSYEVTVPAGQATTIVLCLTRGVNEPSALRNHAENLRTAIPTLSAQLQDDEAFYATLPRLVGDWPDCWKRGWVYDFETLRMTVRPPVGIFRHRWDGMQVHTPRLVLGETGYDAMCLSYADVDLAKEMILGAFADAPAPNVPCCREDGSVNMISAGAAECGTAPIWGLPFDVIHSIYLRDLDDDWVRALYPYLKAYVEWWLAKRTDEEGWFHANCSWESGQDGSKRFLVDSSDPGAVAEFVRTVDIEAAMASAMTRMALFADIAGREGDREQWKQRGAERVARTRAMFVKGFFRDFDGRTGEPILLEDYYDVMMLLPLAVGVATEEQTRAARPWLEYFRDNPKHWLEWPSFMFIYAEAAWAAGMRDLLAEVLVGVGDRVYPVLDQRELRPAASSRAGLPEKYAYRVPGVANEFWPLNLDRGNPGGAENYGWGATLPMNIIRNVIGFRETDSSGEHRFVLAPAFPGTMVVPGAAFGIEGLRFRGVRLDVRYRFVAGRQLRAALRLESPALSVVRVTDEEGRPLAEARATRGAASVNFSGRMGNVFTVGVELDEEERPAEQVSP